MLRATAIAIGICVFADALAGDPPLTPERYYFETRRVRELFEGKEYAQAFPLLQNLTGYYSDDSYAWLAAAVAANEAGQDARALDAALRAIQLGVVNERNEWFEVARLYAKKDDKERALAALERALAKRFTPRTRIRDEPAFQAFTSDARFRQIAGMLPERSFSRDEGWRYDLAFMGEEARRLHASPNREAFSDEFTAAARALDRKIPSLKDAQIRVEMQRLVALLHDGHTGVDIEYQARRLPLRLYAFPEGIFITSASDEHQTLIGSRLLRIGSRPVEQLIADIPPYIPRDNDVGIQWRGPHVLVHMDFLEALGAVRTVDTATIQIESAGGAKRTLDVASVPASDPELMSLYPSRPAPNAPLFLQQAWMPYWTKRLSDETLYFQFNGVWQRREQGIKEFAAELYDELKRAGTRNLIVDIRNNSGGDLGLYPPILQAIAAFRIGDRAHEIYCITGRNTFSAAQAFIGDLERLVDPVFVGEPSSSSPNFVGESTGWIELPYSGTRVTISERYHQHAALPDDGRKWIAPQLPVQLTARDYFSNRDTVMDTLLRVIAARK